MTCDSGLLKNEAINEYPYASFASLKMIVALVYSFSIMIPFITRVYLIVPLMVGTLFVLLTIREFFNTLFSSSFLRCGLVLLAICLFYAVIGYSSASIGNYGNYILCFYSIWIGVYINNFIPYIKRKSIIGIALTFVAFSIATTLFVVITVPDFDLYFYESGLVDYGIQYLNFVSTSYGYGILLLILCFVPTLFGNKSHKALKMLLLLLCAFFIVSILGSATIAFSLIVGLLCFLVFRRDSSLNKSNAFKLIIFLFLVVLLVVVILTNSASFSTLVYSIFGNKIGERFDAVLSVFNDRSNIDNDVFSRIELIGIDINSWFESPVSFFFGNGFHYYTEGSVIQIAVINKCGSHSSIFDIFARYGLLGAFPLLGCLVTLRNVLCKGKKVYFACIIAIIVFNMFFNDIIKYDTILFAFMFIPYFSMLSEGKKNVI